MIFPALGVSSLSHRFSWDWGILALLTQSPWISPEEEDVEFWSSKSDNRTKSLANCLWKETAPSKTETAKRRNGGIRRSGVDGCFRQQIGHQMLTNIERNQFWKWQSEEKDTHSKWIIFLLPKCLFFFFFQSFTIKFSNLEKLKKKNCNEC